MLRQGLRGVWMVLVLEVLSTTTKDERSTLSKFISSFPISSLLSPPRVSVAATDHGGTQGLCIVV